MRTRRAGPLTARGLATALALLIGFLTPQAVAAPAHAVPAVAGATAEDPGLRAQLSADLQSYLEERGEAEHVSAVGLSVSVAGREKTVDVTAGTMTSGGAEPVPTDAVWQIGSNTKAFTSALVLQLEAEGELSIDDPLGTWLPQYPRWADVPMRRLLNMTSGIPDYDEQPAFLADVLADPQRYFSQEALVGYVLDVPATSGYSYSNTNYVLAEMVVEAVTGETYAHELRTRLLEPLGLCDTFYDPDRYPSSVTDREPAGYFAIHAPEAAELFGRDMSRDSLSMARGAGGIISTLADLTRWERALYSGDVLPAEQQAELTSLVSTTTGEPIPQTSPEDPGGFGLGVGQVTVEGLGTFWVYEGSTLGFRVLHVFLPEPGLIVALGLNSATDDDRVQALFGSVYDTLLEHGVLPAPVGPAVDASVVGLAGVG